MKKIQTILGTYGHLYPNTNLEVVNKLTGVLQYTPATQSVTDYTSNQHTAAYHKEVKKNAIKREKKPQSLDFTGSAAHLRLFELGVFLVVLNCICLSFVQIHALFTSITSFILTY